MSPGPSSQVWGRWRTYLRSHLDVSSLEGLLSGRRAVLVVGAVAVPDTDGVRVGCCRAGARLAVVRHVHLELTVAAQAVRDTGRPVHCGDVALARERRRAHLRSRGGALLGEA